jgi:glycosyltransferase involved in cell wall biosynthesis
LAPGWPSTTCKSSGAVSTISDKQHSIGSALKVALDGRELAGAPTGVGRYVAALAAALRRLPGVELTVLQTSVPMLGPHLLLGVQARRLRAEILHGPANGLPFVSFLPGVVTIHDLAIYEHPEWFPSRQWFSTRVLVPRSLRRARVVIVPSAATRAAVGRHFPKALPRTRVIGHGVEPEFSAPIDGGRLHALRTDLSLPERFILQVGTIQPRKNYGTTLRALARVPASERLPLVVAGSIGWNATPALQLIETLGLQQWVRLIGYIGFEDLPALYRLATIVAFPSLDEGFGLPVLEAFASRVPLVAANAGAIPEVAGDAAILVAPGDAPALAQAFIDLSRRAELRQQLIEAGAQRASQTTWEASAREHVRAYEDAIS